MSSHYEHERPLSVLIVDPAHMRDPSDGERNIDVEYCTTGRAALRRADEAIDVLVLNTSIEDIAYEDLAEMFQSESPTTALVVITDEPNATEEAIARRCGAMLYVGKPLEFDLLAQLRTRRRTLPRSQALQLTLDWHRRPGPAATNQTASASG